MKIAFYKKIRFKFMTAFIAVMLVSFILSYFINLKVIQKGISDTASQQFSSALNLTENFIDFVGQTSQIWVHHILSEGNLSRLLANNKLGEIQQMLDTERESIAADTIILLDKEGHIISQSGSVRTVGDSLAYLDIIKNVIDNNQQTSTSITRELDNFIIYSSALLIDNDTNKKGDKDYQGILLIGYFITEAFLDTIKKNTHIDLAIVGNTAIMSSTKWSEKQYIKELPMSFINYQKILENKQFARIKFMDQDYLLAAIKMKHIESSLSGSILMALPEEKFAHIEQQMRQDMSQIFLLLILFVSMIVFFLSSSFLKAIKKLSLLSSKLAGGNFQSRVELKSGDEFQLLADNFNMMAKEIEMKNHELNQLNLNLEQRISQELKKGREKDKLIMIQSRHAAMGEMISMIAHQWRQPLSVITMSANNIMADIEFEQLNPDALKNDTELMIRQAGYLSHTIDDFRSFFLPDKKKEAIKIETIIKNSFDLIGKSFEYNNIKITQFINSNSVLLLYNHEILQVFLNILKNAQEALIENRKSAREVDITIKEDNDFVHTTICDNSGGIDETLINKIFEPYFSTKDKKNGTGLGLYMSKIIVEQHLNGKLSAFNIQYKGCFKISLPKSNQETALTVPD
ncbi:MAG: HAMP domain-containing protein [gamma proteobacterium symbiont of Bathyaustriella thionipta]|nr:HAMP domain-containing protein [gamma proteobacterium symbiont of Bathyaustriella thionipta]MCU7951520.1 HAMP domain-containing protein [gamma proteobacterium symbiont of Bathyaustriella thionipta]MCU7958093.1 HAMP domain-containing protein [gamma proteobacterium symbiont of Bathyaustriella thionipta]MCU7967825.1 HAMP domain-containing protein [gamma proteobacterium symbiont of Bathyaustriella thionipta]